MKIKPWDEYFLDLAKTCASRSNCLRAQVGAVIVGQDKKIKATGYNGTPSKVESCAERGECYRICNNIPSGTRYETCRSIHAEQNAIIQAGQDRCKDATIYIWGHNFICILCKRFIVQSGITHCVLKKNDDSPIVRVSVEDIRRELEEQR
jgi:dCMP deaminase